jgi:hypothetical protein
MILEIAAVAMRTGRGRSPIERCFLHGFKLEYAEYFVSFARASLDDSRCGRKRCFSNNLFRGGMTWQ